MKIQLIILALFVVATLAHRQRDGDDENQVRRRGRWNRRNRDSQVYADAEEAAEMEDAVPTEGDQVTEELAGRPRCGNGGRRGGRRGGHRRHYQGSEHKNREGDSDMSEGETRPQFSHNPDWHQQHGVPMSDGNSEVGRRHHHHHHRRPHHHHHHHHTTTVPTTTTQAAPSSTGEYDNE